QQDYGTGWMDF
uniref:Caerulein-3.1/3.1Y4 n=1 Tax=Ranoidea citropa TaxID=94770 RepID=CAE31_RANCI|nr:RecName: Full=Caerulein-3.1/3.1Y4 [Ranoidea citropa]